MAISTLAADYGTIAQEVAHFLSFSTLTEASFTADEAVIFAEVLRRGTLRFLYPPPLEEGKPSHEWSFLKKATTLSLSNTDFDYDLPDDFGVLVPGSLTFDDGDSKRRMKQVSEEVLRSAQSQNQQTGTPFYYALRAKADTPTTGQLHELLFYPTPNGSMTVRYRYAVSPDAITSVNKYIAGNVIHNETFLAAVLSVAESRMDDDGHGTKYKEFLSCLATSIRVDDEMLSVAA